MAVNSGIYRIDMGNGYFYIGSTINLARRESQHHRDLRRKDHSNSRMQRRWDKYQIFIFTVIEQCEISELLAKEQKLIDKYFSDTKNMNINPTAGTCLGRPRSIETRAKISAAHKGRVHTAEHHAKISVAHKGKIVSAETRAKLSAKSKGQIHTAETRAKMTATRKLRREQKMAK